VAQSAGTLRTPAVAGASVDGASVAGASDVATSVEGAFVVDEESSPPHATSPVPKSITPKSALIDRFIFPPLEIC
jgi:hypothetical protein